MIVDALEYVLITPARDEDLFIDGVCQSVLRQTKQPKLWVIVNDNSADDTAERVRRYIHAAEWIVLVHAGNQRCRPFHSKVYGFNAGYDYIKRQQVSYDVIGNLDADVSCGDDYFEYLLTKFKESSGLGVAGTDYVERGFHSGRDTRASRLHVNGQCQLFRRQCFEDIGGYKPTECGGEDLRAVIMARHHGWETRSFSERVLVHHRAMGTKHTGLLEAKFNHGRHDHIIGNPFLWQLLRVAYWTKHKPYFVGGIMLFLGYFWSFVRGDSIVLPPEALRSYRREQYQRLKTSCLECLFLLKWTKPKW
jgi:poly-beta-1,6-N-acetyl-D-glucosamine synthase